MITHFVLIDFENVQPKNIGLLAHAPCKIEVFLGAKQQKLPVETVRALQTFGENVEYIQIEGHGPNALDFHIAYYVGRLSVESPDAGFHIVSNDAGFDPLIKHLHSAGIACQRCATPKDANLKAAQSNNGHATMREVIAHLEKLKTARPRKLETLTNTMKTFLKSKSAESELNQIMQSLKQLGIVRVKEGKVSYDLPHEP